MRPIYLDYAATTPMDPKVAKVIAKYTTKGFGNPSSLHSFGQRAMGVVDKARAQIAKVISADFRELLFTGSATEANNLALRGAVKKFREVFPSIRPRIIVSAIEHESVLETAKDLEREGVECMVIPVDERGVIDLERLQKELNERTAIVSVMYVNNEVGSIQPIREIASVIEKFKLKIGNSSHYYPLFHTDAVQAFQYFPCDTHILGVDLMTLSAHKLCGPKGIGALFIKNQKSKIKNQNGGNNYVVPIITGGGQEFGMRSGTENVAGIAGFGEAIVLADKCRKKEYARILRLKHLLWKEIHSLFPKTKVNGSKETEFKDVAPHILNVAFQEFPSDELLTRFDMAGIAVSTGSACASRAPTHSHVLSALLIKGAQGIRFSFGRTTTKEEINEVVRRMRTIANRRG
ncbi:MAG: cysteine desulfurase family protein [Candidatus Paceibacterota bacterium]|jgi:cysteine desulfurase